MKKNIISAIKYVLIIMATCMLVFLSSCNCKSGQLMAEKVVILNISPNIEISADGQPIHTYKVKRIQLGVVDYMSTDYLFEAGDTIRYTFIK